LKNGKTISLPNVVAVATAPNYGRFAIGPLEAGVGVPLGNALRRILLSSLPGSAITSVRIQNVFHEFSCIPNVREDVTEIVLNIKNIRLRSYSDRPVRLNLSKYGSGEVRASDIELPANVELVTPDQVLATLDGDDAHIEMELTVERGRGYISFESREGMSIGTIPVDAVFSPVPRVNYVVQPAGSELLAESEDGKTAGDLGPDDLQGRDQVVIEIWTDGTIEPGEALSMAGQHLAQHSSLIATFNRVSAVAQPTTSPSMAAIPPHMFEMSIEDLSLSMRTYNCLKRSGITKIGQVLSKDRKELLGLRNFGEKSFDELYEALTTRDLIPPGSPLDLSIRDQTAIGEEGSGEESGEGDGAAEGDGETNAEIEVGYLEDRNADNMGDVDDATVVIQEMASDQGEVSGQVVEMAGASEGSGSAAAGIFMDDVPSHGEIDMPPATSHGAILSKAEEDTAEPEAETAPRSRSKKK
jgi:DNA-directed RNA polymerase subunit alpha